MRQFKISVGGSRFAPVWQERILSWEELLNRIAVPERGTETQQEYFKMPKSQQDELKDVGGFVGGTLENGKRSAQSVTGRDLITLDLDQIPANSAEEVLSRVRGLGYAYAVYSTRKHTSRAPRLRILVPLSRTATIEEYEPAARMLAFILGIAWCDPTTFQPSRLMYWPSASADGEYIFEYGGSEECSLDGLLWMYADWRDVSSWPIVPGEEAKVERLHKHQENPLEKKGLVGMFCRTYDIYGAMLQFLPGVYEETDKEDRLTYIGGSTAGGAIVYGDGMFLYSHHATDPCSGQLVNAFDLVRLHKFSHMDEDVVPGTKAVSLPSFKAMCDLCKHDEKVAKLIAVEEETRLAEAFQAPAPLEDEYDPEWRVKLEKAADGVSNLNTIENVGLIISNDMNLRGRVWYDEFADRIMVRAPLPWSNEKECTRPWADVDDTGLYWYIEKFYTKKVTQLKTVGGINLVASQNKINPVRNYLERCEWDGVKRMDSVLIRYLGAKDNIYTRTVTKKMLVAAVARVFDPGVKFDNMLILVGRQGIGKSTLFRRLGGPWFSDSITTFEGKEASELIQGVWIAEVGELTAMTRQESNSVKQFLSKQDDQYRAAYARRTEVHPRRCVFVGTSNDDEFLKDTTGNRRFWPVNVGVTEQEDTVFDGLTDEVISQIWAEAVMWYRLGETLYLPRDVEKMAEKEQLDHMITTGKEGIIDAFLETPVPKSWYEMEHMQRQQFLNGTFTVDEELVERKKVCPVEIWMYCYGKPMGMMQRSDVLEIGRIMKTLGWEPTNGSYAFGNLGKSRGYARC